MSDQPTSVHGLIDHIAGFVQAVTKELDEKAPGNERVIQALHHVAGCIGVMKLRIPDSALSAIAPKLPPLEVLEAAARAVMTHGDAKVLGSYIASLCPAIPTRPDRMHTTDGVKA